MLRAQLLGRRKGRLGYVSIWKKEGQGEGIAYFIAMVDRLGMSRFAAAVMNMCVAATSTKSRNVLRTALIIEL
jgi:hypothetical protein